MSKTQKIWLVVAVSLIVVGSLIFSAALAGLDFDFTKLSTYTYETNTYVASGNFDKISIDVTTPDIVFAASDDGSCKVVCFEQEKLKHSVTVQDGTLMIGTVDTRKWYDHIGISFGNTKMTVYLPQYAYASLSIHIDTGDVEIPKDFTFQHISLNSSTGDVLCYASGSDTIEIRTATGEIELTGVNCKSVTVESDTGDISLNNVITQGRLSVRSDTGDVDFEHCDAASIFVKTSAGDVEGTLLSEKIFITETATGDIRVPKTTTGGKCEITTSTGDIEIDIP